jgi:rhamnulokinase
VIISDNRLFGEKGEMTMAGAKYLAFDLGASSGRAMLGTILDEQLSLVEVHRFDNHPVEILGHIHWDILRLFEEMKIGLRRAVEQDHAVLAGIGVDTWGVDFGLVARDDILLGNPYAYRDKRTDGVMEKVFSMIPREEIYRTTGIQFMQLNTIFQLFSMVNGNNPLLGLSEKLLFMPDLLNYLMTGEKVSEYTIASTSQLLNAEKREWEAELFARLSLPIDLMAPVVEPGTKIGVLNRDIQSETGLSPVDVIATAGHDTASAVAAVPAEGSDWAYLSSGTWSLMGIESEKPIINENSLINNFTNEGGVDRKIRFLKNIMGLWLLQMCQKSWARQGEEMSYGEMTELAKQAKPFKHIVEPDDSRFLNPPDMIMAIREFCRDTSQPIPESKADIVRCVLESLALKYRHVLEKINSMRDRPVEKLHIVGGGTQNDLLNRFTSDATGMTVIAGPVEATAIGNILVQAVAQKDLASIQEGRKLVARSFPLAKYEPENAKAWDSQYEKFRNILS